MLSGIKQGRQGDIYAVKATPAMLRAFEAARANGEVQDIPLVGPRLVLQEGEVTGHHHGVDVKDVKEAARWLTQGVVVWTVTETAEAPAITHDEHDIIPLVAGETYFQIGQREWDAREKIQRRVVD